MNADTEQGSRSESHTLRTITFVGAFAVAAFATAIEGPHLAQHALEAASYFLTQHMPINLPPLHGDPGVGEVSSMACQQVQRLGSTVVEHF